MSKKIQFYSSPYSRPDPFLEFFETWKRGNYFGHGRGDETFQAVPITSLDSAAMKHDFAYATSGSGRSGRAQKASADLDMAGEVFLDNPLVGAAMAGQFAVRVLTFNLFDLPWAD